MDELAVARCRHRQWRHGLDPGGKQRALTVSHGHIPTAGDLPIGSWPANFSDLTSFGKRRSCARTLCSWYCAEGGASWR